MKINCDQCDMMSINGVACHETGCPNGRKTWVEARGWVLYLDCFECGCPVEDGEVCGCQEECMEVEVVATREALCMISSEQKQ